MRFVRAAVAACVVLLAVTAATAQTGGIEVSVTDQEGLPLPGATVTISNELGYVKTTTEVTDRNGEVVFPVLRPGEGYSIQVSFPGFSPIRYDDVRVKLSQTQPLRVQMIEEFQEQVKVIAESDVVDLDKTESSTRFSDDFISDLPVPGRFYQNVLTMAPGVQDADGDGNPNVHGSRSRDFQAVVGNVSNVDPLTGQSMSRINTNSIEEMEVITAGAGVEFGRAQGGFARIIQKQGSNTHEGIVEVYWRTSKLDGDGANDSSDLDTPEFDSWQPGFQFSGPLVKDKLWYRASYEQIDDEQPVNVLTGIEVFERTRETQDAQVTWQVSPRNKVAFQFRADPDEASNFNISSRVRPESAISFDRDVETWTVNWTAPYSPKVLVESTFAWQDINNNTGPTQAGLFNDCVPNAKENFLNRQRFTVKGQATVYGGRFWGMSHQFKLGINIENERYFRNLDERTIMNYIEVSATNSDDAGEGTGDEGDSLESYGFVLARMSVPQNDDVRATGTNWALYAEDQFKPTQDLTITLGARLDREELNSGGRQAFDPTAELAAFTDHIAIQGPTAGGEYERFFTGYEDIGAFRDQILGIICEGRSDFEACLAQNSPNITDQEETSLDTKRKARNINITNTNVSPFISLGWSPWANGKTAFKVTAGRYYNNLPLNIPLQELEPAQVTLQYRASLISEDNCPDPGDLPPDVPPPSVACGQVELQGSIEPRLTVLTVDRDLQTPYQDEFTFKVERELWAETSVSLS
ncbi:MAG: TonB-dependent receptor, partial [Planctomycetota bacterium]